MSHPFQLDGQVAIVTGTSPHIGGAIAEALGRAGASIVAVDADESNAQGCAAALRHQDVHAAGLQLDVTDANAVDAAVEETVRRFGGVDILVNNAVRYRAGGVLDMEPDGWHAVVETVLTGAFLMTRSVARSMLATARRGAIINIASTAAHQGEPGNVAYSTAKAGILNFTRSVAGELGPHGIRVNSLTPTTTTRRDLDARVERWGVDRDRFPAGEPTDEWAQRLPLRRFPSAEEYGNAAVFLASPAAAGITGMDLRVDAGAISAYWRQTGSERRFAADEQPSVPRKEPS